MEERNEIIVYQPEGGEFHIEVRLDKDTVWLNRQQMAVLFGRDVKTIGKHINNALKEELRGLPTVANFATVQEEGGRKVSRNVEHYTLDMILSVGYRVKSQNGILFRQWANQVLKEHLLRGASVNQRFMLTEERVDRQLINHEKRLDELDSKGVETSTRLATLEKQVDFFVKANLPPSEGILNAKSWWSGYEFACQLVRSAKEEIIVIDPFADDVALSLVAKKSAGVNAFVYSGHVNRHLREEEERLNRQFPTVKLEGMQNVHDRFIIVDETVYHIGSSFNELGKKLTAFSVLNFVSKQQLLEMVSQASGKKNN
ncbi:MULTISPECIES: RhuM family protein [unclassified Fibrobacter]|uniref:RhuM family protein n=1 Tax=unclassified Fibrobacter TaxID=2634177 RepID=UPI000D6CDCC5|nr:MULTISPECIES: RhuM family protein [unclassified Fibrobacter]PWJ61241.1 virulence RhuM family protein [Fibrobacter sp. UWR4]PZW66080.1 virulence RhuM family protein [Fibrobacter sp. UWR1]